MSNETKNKKCLLMFSGGYDTLLSTCLLVEDACDVLLISYDNGMETGIESVEDNFKRLQKIYGKKVQFLGIETMVGTWRKFLIPYMLKTRNFDKYNLLPMEYFCLTCRTSMYIHTLAECLNSSIPYLAEGARKSQNYPEQTEQVIEKFRKFCKEFDRELLLPVFSVESKSKIKEELALRGVIPKTKEFYCTLAMPLYDYKPSEENIKSMGELLDEFILPEAENLVKDVLKIKKHKKKGKMA